MEQLKISLGHYDHEIKIDELGYYSKWAGRKWLINVISTLVDRIKSLDEEVISLNIKIEELVAKSKQQAVVIKNKDRKITLLRGEIQRAQDTNQQQEVETSVQYIEGMREGLERAANKIGHIALTGDKISGELACYLEEEIRAINNDKRQS